MPTTDQPDVYGHCVSCGKDLIVHKTVDGKIVKIFSPKHQEMTFKLDDGSEMRVCACVDCNNRVTERNYRQIMKNVAAGWRIEVDALVKDVNKPHWDKERAENYMEKYGERKIAARIA